MPALREVLSDAGFEDVKTYVQSGNVVLGSDENPDGVARKAERLVAEHFGFDVDIVVRTARELGAVVKRNPLGDVASDPKLYQVSFLAKKPPSGLAERLADDLAVDGERVLGIGRELYAWLPGGAARSKLWAALANPAPGLVGTSRNWRTVEALRAMAEE